jgi:hypothetical protein
MLLVSHVAGSLRTKSVITGHTVAVFAGPIWSSPAYRSLTLRIAYTKPYGCPNHWTQIVHAQPQTLYRSRQSLETTLQCHRRWKGASCGGSARPGPHKCRAIGCSVPPFVAGLRQDVPTRMSTGGDCVAKQNQALEPQKMPHNKPAQALPSPLVGAWL